MLRVMTVITCGLSADAFWGQIKAHAATRNIVPAHRPPVTDLSVINICSLFDVRNICSCPQLANASPPPRTRSQAQQQQNRPNCDTHIETCCHGVKKKHRSVTKLLHLIRAQKRRHQLSHRPRCSRKERAVVATVWRIMWGVTLTAIPAVFAYSFSILATPWVESLRLQGAHAVNAPRPPSQLSPQY